MSHEKIPKTLHTVKTLHAKSLQGFRINYPYNEIEPTALKKLFSSIGTADIVASDFNPMFDNPIYE